MSTTVQTIIIDTCVLCRESSITHTTGVGLALYDCHFSLRFFSVLCLCIIYGVAIFWIPILDTRILAVLTIL